jgi:heat shock protein HtpX
VRDRLLILRNVVKCWAIPVVVGVLLGGLGWSLGGYRVSILFAGSIVLLAAAIYTYADRIVMGMLGARELVQGESPALHSTVERLSLSAGIVKPKLYVLPDSYPRALSAGRGAGGGSGIAVSLGLMGVASPAELEGIVAHEIAHIRHRDVLLQTVVVIVAMCLVELSRIGGALQRALLFVLAPVAASFVHLMLSPRREFAADRTAAALCASPHGLADALLRLEQAAELVEFRASPATEPLYPFNPFLEEGLATLFDTHPPMADRIRRLRDLDPGWRDKLRTAAA